VGGTTGEPPDQQDRNDGQHREQRRSPGRRRPRHRRQRRTGSEVRHPDHPPDEDARARGQSSGRRLVHRRDDSRQHAEDGGRRDSRCRQQVGRHRDQTDLTAEQDDDRRADQGSRQWHRDGLCQYRGSSPLLPPTGPPWREQHQPTGRQHGQHEAVRPGQPRVDQEQHHDRGTECRQTPTRATADHRGQRHRTHRRGPQDRRLGPGEHHEAEHRDRRERGQPPAAYPDIAPDHQDEAGHDGEVGARHSRQVSEAGRAEVGLEALRHP
jgi:hypothetical protein